MLKVKYTNRYNDIQTFEVNERGNIQWKFDSEFSRYGVNDKEDITMVDPAGGPLIDLGYNMGIFNKSLDGMVVIGFISNKQGYELVIKQK